MNDIIISPIFYMGNKKKLIKKGLIDRFPDDIDIFFDLFSGSGIVSMNTKAKEYILNDINHYLIELYNVFKFFNIEKLLAHINSRIDEYKLPRERTKRNLFNNEVKLKEYKNAYNQFREFYNNTHFPSDLLTLTFFSFSQQFRFSKSGKYNMPFGNDCFSKKNEEYIKNGCNFFSGENVYISEKDFTHFAKNIIVEDVMNKNDFVYLDPPYFDTIATYNENNGWTENDEKNLFHFCEILDSFNIKWGMSNIFNNKYKENTHLIKWCDNNNWNVHHFEDFKYMACGKGSNKIDEVFICNYTK